LKPDLNGLRVLVTRPAHQAANLTTLLEQHYARVIALPTLDIVDPDDVLPITQTLENLDRFQWLIFISANAVNFALKANGGKIARSTNRRIVAVGQATAQALLDAQIPVDLVPENGFSTEALLAMPVLQQVKDQQILIVRGVGGREALAETLRGRGAKVEYLQVYKRIIPSIDCSVVIGLLEQQQIDVLTITSAEALQNLLIMLGENNHKLLFRLPLIVMSDRIQDIAASLGFERITVSKSPSDAAILDTLTTYAMGK